MVTLTKCDDKQYMHVTWMKKCANDGLGVNKQFMALLEGFAFHKVIHYHWSALPHIHTKMYQGSISQQDLQTNLL